MSYEALLNQLATIRRATVATSSQGEETSTWADLATNVKCCVQAARGGLARYDQGEIVEASFRGFFLKGQSLMETDKVVVDGIEYDVRFVQTIRNHHIEAALSRGLRKQA